jgi:hypothetical protein
MDKRGSDIRSIPTTDVNACKVACDNETSSCSGFLHLPVRNSCLLKSSLIDAYNFSHEAGSGLYTKITLDNKCIPTKQCASGNQNLAFECKASICNLVSGAQVTEPPSWDTDNQPLYVPPGYEGYDTNGDNVDDAVRPITGDDYDQIGGS